MINVLDSQLRTVLSEQDNQEDQLGSIVSAFGAGAVTVKVISGSTLLATLTHSPFYMQNVTPRRIVLGGRVGRVFSQNGTPTKVVFANATTDLFEIAAGVGSGPVTFTNSVNQLAVEKMQGVYVESDSTLPVTPVLNLIASSPNRVVLESWETGSAVDVGTITLDTLIRADRFADPSLANDCRGWLEYGPSSDLNLPVLNGVQFSAKGFDIKSNGVYSQRSYRVMVAMRAVGVGSSGVKLKDGLFGDVRGVNHYPGAHKLRVLSVDGTVLKTIEMRDGLPMNHPSLVNCPYNWTVTTRPGGTFFPEVAHTGTRLPSDEAMRPWMSAGSVYVAFFGDTPMSSTNTLNKIPRVKSDLWIGKGTKVRSIYGGDDVHLFDQNYGGNGNAHPEVTREWALSVDEANAIPTVVQNDTEIIYGVQGYNWVNALRTGWGYEPGALGGITRRGGPGGQRMDRSLLGSELVQMGLTQEYRTNDLQATAPMVRGYALNHANYPGYYPVDMLSLDAANQFSSSVQFPESNVIGGLSFPVFHYYGDQANLSGEPSAIWIGDTYGPPPGPVEQVIEWANPGAGASASTHPGHVRNGWCPDSEHVNRMGNSWSTLLYADPLFARMHEHLMFENQMMWNGLANTSYAGINSNSYLINQCWNISHSRTAILPFAGAALQWWTATNAGVYKRSEIESKIHAWAALHATDLRSNFTDVVNNATHRAFQMTGGIPVSWKTWGASGNYAAGSGWVATISIYTVYLAQWLMILKTSGLWDVLRVNLTTRAWLDDMVKQLEFIARMSSEVPWAISSTGSFDAPNFILRSADQGANQSLISTVPDNVSDCISYNPAYRVDQLWFLKTSDLDGATPVHATNGSSFNYAGWARFQIAYTWWKYFATHGAERDTGISKLEGVIAAVKNYSVTVYDAGFTRFNSPQIIPALEV